MILIADSGSTKTTWVLTGTDKKKFEFHSQGFNPYTQTKELISQIIKDEVFQKIKDFDIHTIYFYGAGCSTPENKKIMYDSFKKYLPQLEIEIEHDLLAAARALWFDKEGIAAILGTGSNSCIYNGDKIVKAVPSLGFILGDEGSGCYMGKMLIRDYLYNRLPKEIHEKFHKQYQMDATTILDHIYKKENPNRWMATFAIFISDNITHDYCRKLVLKSMRDFFEAHLMQYDRHRDLPLGVNGSIGYYLKDLLEIVSNEYGFQLKKVIKSPIDELVRYHLSKMNH